MVSLTLRDRVCLERMVQFCTEAFRDTGHGAARHEGLRWLLLCAQLVRNCATRQTAAAAEPDSGQDYTSTPHEARTPPPTSDGAAAAASRAFRFLFPSHDLGDGRETNAGGLLITLLEQARTGSAGGDEPGVDTGLMLLGQLCGVGTWITHLAACAPTVAAARRFCSRLITGTPCRRWGRQLDLAARSGCAGDSMPAHALR